MSVGAKSVAPGKAVRIAPPVSMSERARYGALVDFPADFVLKHLAPLGWEEAAASRMEHLTAYAALTAIARLA